MVIHVNREAVRFRKNLWAPVTRYRKEGSMRGRPFDWLKWGELGWPKCAGDAWSMILLFCAIHRGTHRSSVWNKLILQLRHFRTDSISVKLSIESKLLYKGWPRSCYIHHFGQILQWPALTGTIEIWNHDMKQSCSLGTTDAWRHYNSISSENNTFYMFCLEF